MRIYISIPISGHDLATQQRKALEVADKLRELGHEPVNPFDTPKPEKACSEREEYAYYMGEDIKKLLTCDAVFLCDGWHRSKGCRLEMQTALLYGMRLYERLEDIQNGRLTEEN